MADELTPKKEEAAKSILEQIKEERANLDNSIAESKKIADELRELGAKEMLGGGTNAGQTKEKPKVETPKEYADRVLKGEIKPI